MRRLVLAAAAVLILFLVGCAPHMRDPVESNASLAYGYIDMYEAPSTVTRVGMRQYKPLPLEGRPYHGTRSVNGLFWFDQLTPGAYQITSFGGQSFCLNRAFIYNLPDFAKNTTAITIDRPGLYFMGSYEYKADGSFRSDKFKFIKVDSPTEKEVLEMMLPFSTGTQWEAMIKKRMGGLK